MPSFKPNPCLSGSPQAGGSSDCAPPSTLLPTGLIPALPTPPPARIWSLLHICFSFSLHMDHEWIIPHFSAVSAEVQVSQFPAHPLQSSQLQAISSSTPAMETSTSLSALRVWGSSEDKGFSDLTTRMRILAGFRGSVIVCAGQRVTFPLCLSQDICGAPAHDLGDVEGTVGLPGDGDGAEHGLRLHLRAQEHGTGVPAPLHGGARSSARGLAALPPRGG